MKKTLLLVCAITALCSCGKSNEDKAREVIESELKTTMKDWNSYEFVEMSKVDSAFTLFMDSQEGKVIRELQSALSSKKTEYEVNSRYPELYKERIQVMRDSIPIIEHMEDSLKNVYDTKEKEYKGNFIGYRVKFKYRGNNSLGGKEISSSIYFFNPEITQITDRISLD